MVSKFLLLLLTGLALTSSAYADDISLGEPAYGGTGCPAGSAAATLSPDAKSLSILFDQYVSEAGGSTGKSLDRKSCNIAIPVHVPQGLSVAIMAVDYRGFRSVPPGAEARFNVEYFFAGMRGPRGERSFRGPSEGEYLINHNLIAGQIVWSPCGADVNLRINSSMLARTNASFAQTMATVDSTDVSAGLIYHLQWRQCR